MGEIEGKLKSARTLNWVLGGLLIFVIIISTIFTIYQINSTRNAYLEIINKNDASCRATLGNQSLKSGKAVIQIAAACTSTIKAYNDSLFKCYDDLEKYDAALKQARQEADGQQTAASLAELLKLFLSQ